MGGRRAEIPIIAITANTFEDDRREAMGPAGMNAHVAKPYKPEELVATITKLIGK